MLLIFKKLYRYKWLFFALINGCTINPSSNFVCKFKEIKTLFTVVGIQPGLDTGYAHYILLKDFSRECMDSTTLVNIAMKYIDTISFDKPVDMLHIYNSDKDFIPGETSQIWENVDKSCLLQIWIDKKNNRPEKFVFFNDNGDRVYEGTHWLKAK